MKQQKNKYLLPVLSALSFFFLFFAKKSLYSFIFKKHHTGRRACLSFQWPCLCLLAWGIIFPAYAQDMQDTIVNVRIESQKVKRTNDLRKDFSAGQQNQVFDSISRIFYQDRSLDHLLAEQSPVFVKNYGVNSMATLSFRGASAAQSAVLWNGIPIANPALGVSDISILNAGLFEHISLHYGGSAALYGSGNVGGALLLEDASPDFIHQKSASLSLGIGSFGQKEAALKALYQNSRWRFGINAFYQFAYNDFPYSDGPKGQVLKMDNARMQGFGGIFSADYNLSKATGKPEETLSLRLWFQHFDREIPPALFESFSVKKQQDQSLRSLLQWQKRMGGSRFYVKASLNKDELQYEDGIVLPDNKNEVMQFYGEAGWSWKVNRPVTMGRSSFFPLSQELFIFTPFQYSMARSENLTGTPTQFRPAIAVAYQVRSFDGKLRANFAFREEWTAGHVPAALPGAGVLYRLISRSWNQSDLMLDLRGNIQRSYRVPTINELYFSPGGNSQLKPEQGWNEDGGFDLKLRFKKNSGNTASYPYRWVIQQESAVFNRNIRDWIYWLGGAIWTPHNLAEVHSRGLETESRIAWQRSGTRVFLSLKTAYVLSTTVASYLPGDGSIGKQIPYTPRYNGRINLGMEIGNFLINYNHSYTGYRFVTVDESQFLDPYQTGNIQALCTFRHNSYELKCIAQVLNVWNTQYEIVNGRPMPGRQYLLRLQLAL